MKQYWLKLARFLGFVTPIETIFPLTVDVTQDIVVMGRNHIYDENRCIGVLTLKKVLDAHDVSYNQVVWGLRQGRFWTGDPGAEKEYEIRSTQDMTDIEAPTTVTLTLVNAD